MKTHLAGTVAAFVCAVVIAGLAAQTMPPEAQKHLDAAQGCSWHRPRGSVGNDVVRRYLTVANECGQAALAIVPPA